MNHQSEFNFTGNQLRDAGISLATEHADAVEKNWSGRAYDFVVKEFLPRHKRFMAEDIRSYAAEMDFPLPPSARAWGGIMLSLKKSNLIICIGINQVKNPKAHCANANVYERNDERMIEEGLLQYP